MTLLWIPFTIMAAFMQSLRNALQKQLRQHASTLGVTLARFLFALPLSALYLLGLYRYFSLTALPTFTPQFFAFVAIAAVTQIAATAFMVSLFKTSNYAIGVGLAKSEAVMAATLGALFFGADLSSIAWIGVVIGGVAVWLMSLNNTADKKSEGVALHTIGMGLASGLCFALCTLFIRQASLTLQNSSVFYDTHQAFLLSAAWVLFFVLLVQTTLLTLWLAKKEPQTFTTLSHHKRLTISVSLFSFLGSIGWFTAMSLQTVAMVKTLGQIEVIFTIAISAYWFKEKLARNDYLGLALIVLGAILVVMA